ncbi:hypothetical protein SAMD00019534_019040 [Acytostelium subglobosum LB1]|uniref:hypothetical protein n=1 Tax=Acytostelium subglobosum LB1 TaxID=1410327 RepID=UPI0006450731|nr:hypothetical protein SAMD00019534_019040 [Acytostelium subglobosum LB1]GAM18729.1 hypothetical protein SAMD00019534_019040 [Acytostelium subglobosum LB1]|eukprot:XP_012757949.1 hypothetical protein SAMD00019534_019040 [Acytostelium subglobosum LB1]
MAAPCDSSNIAQLWTPNGDLLINDASGLCLDIITSTLSGVPCNNGYPQHSPNPNQQWSRAGSQLKSVGTGGQNPGQCVTISPMSPSGYNWMLATCSSSNSAQTINTQGSLNSNPNLGSVLSPPSPKSYADQSLAQNVLGLGAAGLRLATPFFVVDPGNPLTTWSEGSLVKKGFYGVLERGDPTQTISRFNLPLSSGLLSTVSSVLGLTIAIEKKMELAKMYSQMLQEAQKIVSQDIDDSVYALVNSNLQGLANLIQSYYAPAMTSCNVSSSYKASILTSCLAVVAAQESVYQNPAYSYLLLPIFAQYGGIQLSILRDAALYGPSFGLPQNMIDWFSNQLDTKIQSYSSYVNGTISFYNANTFQVSYTGDFNYKSNAYDQWNAFSNALSFQQSNVLFFSSNWAKYSLTANPNGADIDPLPGFITSSAIGGVSFSSSSQPPQYGANMPPSSFLKVEHQVKLCIPRPLL